MKHTLTSKAFIKESKVLNPKMPLCMTMKLNLIEIDFNL